MPCQVDDSWEQAKEREQLVTMLCASCKVIEAHGLWDDGYWGMGVRNQLLTWWEKHRIEDAIRVEREQQEKARSRAAALASLEPWQKEALGL